MKKGMNVYLNKDINKKIAVIYYDKNTCFAKLIQKTNVTVVSAYKKTNLLLRIIRKIHFNLKIKNKDIWFKKNNNLENYEIILIFDPAINKNYLEYISNLYSQKKIILWYWNPVRYSINPKEINNKIEKWSYSIEDCGNYCLNYNTTFYFKDLVDRFVSNKAELEYDIYFVGRDKGRLDILLNYKKQFEALGLSASFHITPDECYLKWKNSKYKHNISYDEIIEQINKSKSILDIVYDQSDGLTLRVMESIFFEKKLITNKKNIKEYDFYNKNNIFILEEDNIEDLNNFINGSYATLPDNIIAKYEFKNWIQRFNNEETKCDI